jgi:dihydropteroate synthase
VLETLIQSFPDAIFSVDTWRAEVAKVALETGAHCINDITGGTVEPEIIDIVSGSHAPLVMMHMLGTPGQMPVRPFYSDITSDVLKFFVERIRVLREAGVTDIVLDPGFGFGKSVEDNFALLRKLEVFQFLELPLMIGISRKSMIWRTLGISSEEALIGTTALHMIALQKGVDILRVHDVAAARQTIQLYQRFSSLPE